MNANKKGKTRTSVQSLLRLGRVHRRFEQWRRDRNRPLVNSQPGRCRDEEPVVSLDWSDQDSESPADGSDWQFKNRTTPQHRRLVSRDWTLVRLFGLSSAPAIEGKPGQT